MLSSAILPPVRPEHFSERINVRTGRQSQDCASHQETFWETVDDIQQHNRSSWQDDQDDETGYGPEEARITASFVQPTTTRCFFRRSARRPRGITGKIHMVLDDQPPQGLEELLEGIEHFGSDQRRKGKNNKGK